MDVVSADRLRDSDRFTKDVLASLNRAGWQERAAWCQQGLLIDGRRKSIQPMAARLRGTVREQALNYFVTNGPWRVEPVRTRIAEMVHETISPAAWAVDDTGLLKCRRPRPNADGQDAGVTSASTARPAAVLPAKRYGRCASGTPALISTQIRCCETPRSTG